MSLYPCAYKDTYPCILIRQQFFLGENFMEGHSIGEISGPRTAIIGIGNQKGGVGKTTITVQLACALAELGRKVLIVDLDVNAGSTKHFGIKPEGFLGTFEVLVGDEEPLDVIITHEDEDNQLPEGVHLLPGSRKLESLDERLRTKKSKFDPVPLHDCLKPVVEKLRGHYDYVFLDTPPSAPLPIIAAYKAADGFLLVAIPEGLAIQGLNEALHDIEEVRKYGNSKLELVGIAIGAVESRTRLSRELVAYVAGTFKDYQLLPVIPRSTIVPTAQTQGTTIFRVDATHTVCQAFRDLALSFETNIEKFLGIKHSVQISSEVAANG
jgi:chromosome partitioning protein